MNSKEYKRLLKLDRWKNFSNDVKRRDGFKCVKCGSDKHLQAHHKIYYENRLPWDYSIDFLETLCTNCHLNEHRIKHISQFEVDTKTFKKMRRENRRKNKTLAVNVKGKNAAQIYAEMFGSSSVECNDAPF